MIRDYEQACRVLGVPVDAPQEQIKSAYRNLAKRLHPDNHPQQNEKVREAYRLVTEAYAYIEQHPEARKVQHPKTGANGHTVDMAPQGRILGTAAGTRGDSAERSRDRKRFEEKAQKARQEQRAKMQEEIQARRVQIDQEKKEKAILNEIRAIRLAHAIRAMLAGQGIE
ncbi:MAG: DnaJ domain-containing protein [Lachnospiraceae bacterium]|nr:DnaJ domain-containing protein [Lachnospiraceae bacterium]